VSKGAISTSTSYGQSQACKSKGMFPNCFTCPHDVIQYNKHLLNGQNQETKLFSGTKFYLIWRVLVEQREYVVSN